MPMQSKHDNPDRMMVESLLSAVVNLMGSIPFPTKGKMLDNIIKRKKTVGELIIQISQCKDLSILNSFALKGHVNLEMRDEMSKTILSILGEKYKNVDHVVIQILAGALMASLKIKSIYGKDYKKELLVKSPYFSFRAFEIFSILLMKFHDGVLPSESLSACMVFPGNVKYDDELFARNFEDPCLRMHHPSSEGILYPTAFSPRKKSACIFNNYQEKSFRNLMFECGFNSGDEIEEILKKCDYAIAGGSVLKTLILSFREGNGTLTAKDVDVFPIGKKDVSSLIKDTQNSIDEMTTTFSSSYKKKISSSTYVDWAETRNAFTLLISIRPDFRPDFRTEVYEPFYYVRELQIVKRLYRSVLEVILSFDIAPCRCAIYHDNTYISLTAMYSFINGAYFVDPDMTSTVRRLSKYIKKGFVPMFPMTMKVIETLGTALSLSTKQLNDVCDNHGYCCATFICLQELIKRSKERSLESRKKNIIKNVLQMELDDLIKFTTQEKETVISGMAHMPLPILFNFKRHAFLTHTYDETLAKIDLIDKVLDHVRDNSGISFDGIPLNLYKVSPVIGTYMPLKFYSGKIADRSALKDESSWKITDPTLRLYADNPEGFFECLPKMKEYMQINLSQESCSDEVTALSAPKNGKEDISNSANEFSIMQHLNCHLCNICTLCSSEIIRVDECMILGCDAGHMVHRDCGKTMKTFESYSRDSYCPMCSRNE